MDIKKPLIYPAWELPQRVQFRQFIEKLFDVKTGDKGNVRGIDAETLKMLYCFVNKDTHLTTAMINNLLYAGGFTDTESADLACINGDLNMYSFQGLPKEAQIMIIRYIVDKKTEITCRQLILGKVRITAPIQPDISTVVTDNTRFDELRLWLTVFTINHENCPVYFNSSKPMHRSQLTEVYIYYSSIMLILNKMPLDKKLFKEKLSDLGYLTKQGLVNGKSGKQFYNGFIIPRTREDLRLTMDYGMAVISNEEIHWTPDGILENLGVPDYYLEENIRRFGYERESQIETIKEYFQRTDYRRAIETRTQITIQSATELEAKENLVGHIKGRDEVVQKTETKVTASKYNDGEDADNITAEATHQNRGAANTVDYSLSEYDDPDSYDGEDPLRTTEDDSGSGSDEGAWNDTFYNPPTIDEVVIGLKPIYMMNGNKLSASEIDRWLSTMNTSLELLETTFEELLARLKG